MPHKHFYKRGEPVWAHMEGFPWWPARVVRRDDIALHPGEDEPVLNDGELLVEFFNDNTRFAPMHHYLLRPFLLPYYSNLNAYYDGTYKQELHVAVKKAMKYCRKHAYHMKLDDGTRVPHPRPPEPEGQAQGDGVKQDDVQQQQPQVG